MPPKVRSAPKPAKVKPVLPAPSTPRNTDPPAAAQREEAPAVEEAVEEPLEELRVAPGQAAKG